MMLLGLLDFFRCLDSPDLVEEFRRLIPLGTVLCHVFTGVNWVLGTWTEKEIVNLNRVEAPET